MERTVNNDITSILRLNSWAGRVVLVFYGVGTTVVALMNLTGLVQPIIGVVALVLLWGGLALLGLPQGEPLALQWTIGIVVIVGVVTAISSGNIANPEHPGFANWYLGAMTFLLFVLALRGRRGFAWIGFATLAAVSIAVALIANQVLASVINDVLRQSATLLIGTLFAIVLRRATHTISSIQASQLRLAKLAAATADATGQSAAQSLRLEEEARPALERVIDPRPFTQQELDAFAALESSMRFGVQPKSLSGDRIADATRQASDRGLNVTLFDDRGAALSPEDRIRLEEAMLPLLSDTRVTSIIARLSPEGTDEIATIVVEESGAFRRVVVSHPSGLRTPVQGSPV